MTRVQPASEREQATDASAAAPPLPQPPATTTATAAGAATSASATFDAAKSNGRVPGSTPAASMPSSSLPPFPEAAPPHVGDPHKPSFESFGAMGPRSPTVNRRAWKLLGKAALLARALNPREDVIDIYHDPKEGVSQYMIHPNSKFRRVWEVLTACCVLYVCVVVPLVIGFNYVEWGDRYILDTIVDVYFIVDIFVTLRTGIFSNGEVIMDSRVVLRKYLRTWFVIDIISNFPLALFVQSSARKSIKMVKLQKLPKLLRFGRLLKYLREYAKYYNLALSLVAMIMALHFFACLWASLFNTCFDAEGNGVCESSEMPMMYVQSMHTIVLMFLGISESSTYLPLSHLMEPHRDASIELYIMSTVVFMLGMVFTSFFFGNILALIMSWDQLSAQFRNRMDIIRAEMKYYELPEELQHRVRRNYDYLWINQRAYSDMMLLNQPGISKTLRMTIALHLYKDLVKTVPFFAGSDVRFLGKVCMALETAVYLPGDTIIYYDDIGKEMFIVRKGLVEIIIPEAGNADKRIYLRDGNFFGETALVIDVRRTNTVRAVNICDLNVLSKTSFNEIVAEYPEFGERMKRTVIKRQLDNMNIQSPSEKMKIQNQLNLVVEKSLKARRMSVSLRTIYRAKKLGDKLKEIADRAAMSNQGRRISHQMGRLSLSVTNPRNDATNGGGGGALGGLAAAAAATVAGGGGRNGSHGGHGNHGHAASGAGSRGGRAIPHSHNYDNRTSEGSFAPIATAAVAAAGLHHHPGVSETRSVGNSHIFPSPVVPPPSIGGSGGAIGAAVVNGLGGGLRAPATAAHIPPMLSKQGTPSSSRRLNQIDAVSRKLSKAEISMDLIPKALMEITNMVNQIKRTTDRLSRRLHQNSDGSSDDDDGDDMDEEGDEDDEDADLDDMERTIGGFPSKRSVGGGGGGTAESPGLLGKPLITPLYEVDEEMARRESRSIFTPLGSPRNTSGELAMSTLAHK